MYIQLTQMHQRNGPVLNLVVPLVRICPEEIMQNVGRRECPVHKDTFPAILFRLVKNWKQSKELIEGDFI